MIVLLSNFVIFVIVIIFICSVDLSTITLDSSTERLLYDVQEDSETEAATPPDSTQDAVEHQNVDEVENSEEPRMVSNKDRNASFNSVADLNNEIEEEPDELSSEKIEKVPKGKASERRSRLKGKMRRTAEPSQADLDELQSKLGLKNDEPQADVGLEFKDEDSFDMDSIDIMDSIHELSDQ